MILRKAYALCAAQRDQRDFRGDAESNGGADGAESAIDVEYGKRRLRMTGGRRAVVRRIVCILERTIIGRGHGERAEVGAGNVVGDKTRRAQAVVKDFDLDLAAVSVTGQRQLDAKLRSAIKRVRIVREQDVRHVLTNQGSEIGKHLKAMAARG